MKKIQWVYLLLSILFLTIIPSAPASAEDMMDNLLPQEEKKESEGDVKLEYNKYSFTRYGMDTQLEEEELSDMAPWKLDEKVRKNVNQGMAILNSSLWNFNKLIAGSVGALVSEAYNFDFITDFADDIASVIQKISGFGPGGFSSNGLWPYLATTFIVITGVWAAYVGYVKRATSVALSGILSTIIVITIALGFFTNADKILIGINKNVSAIQHQILSFGLTTTTPGNYDGSEGMATMRNQIFNTMQKDPYLLLNFGTSDEEKIEKEWDKKGSRVDAILKTKIFSKERNDAINYEVKKMKNNNMKPDSLPDRFVVLILVLIFNLCLGLILILLTLSMIAYQVGIMVFAMMTPFAFLFALIPTFNRNAQSIILKLLHAFYMKLGLTLLATLYFSISAMVYKGTDPKSGYILSFLFQIVCAAVIYFKRKTILNIITTPFKNENVNNDVGLNVRDYKKNYFKSKKYFNKFTKPLTQKASTRTFADRTGFNKLKARPGVGAVDVMRHPMHTKIERTTPNKVAAAPSTRPIERKNQTTKESAPPIQKKNINTNNYPRPSLNDRANMESLEKTLEKGGYAHNTKENVHLKRKPALIKRQKTGTQNESQPKKNNQE